MSREELDSLKRQTQRLLKSLQSAGIQSVPAAHIEPVTLSPSKGDPTPVRQRPLADSARTDSQKETLLAPIREQALVCTKCKLCQGRTKVVFGEGSLNARLVFVGEGPGRDEDQQGRPFVGAAGKLLTKIIEAMKMRREDVYICNIVKCRPPNNRPPEPDEMAACREYLDAQLTTIAPKIICALGKTAVTALLETEASMSSLRGRVFDWKGSSLVVTYHPAYLLRNPPAKKLVWEDMRKVMRLLSE